MKTIALCMAPLLLVLSGCKQLPPPKPVEQLTDTERTGRIVFHAHCSMCHYDRVDKPLRGPSLLSVFKQPYLPSGAPANDERVTNTILHGHGMMPALGDEMTQEETQELLAYLHTL